MATVYTAQSVASKATASRRALLSNTRILSEGCAISREPVDSMIQPCITAIVETNNGQKASQNATANPSSTPTNWNISGQMVNIYFGSPPPSMNATPFVTPQTTIGASQLPVQPMQTSPQYSTMMEKEIPHVQMPSFGKGLLRQDDNCDDEVLPCNDTENWTPIESSNVIANQVQNVVEDGEASIPKPTTRLPAKRSIAKAATKVKLVKNNPTAAKMGNSKSTSEAAISVKAVAGNSKRPQRNVPIVAHFNPHSRNRKGYGSQCERPVR